MNDRFVIPKLESELTLRKFPTMVGWNRLEGRPRTDDLKDALRAEVHDALFMCTRQWQMGEYKGDDAGSPIAVASLASAAPLTRYQCGQAAPADLQGGMPLEARVEARPIPFEAAGRAVALDLRLQIGRYWLKLAAGAGDFAADYIRLYPVDARDPADPRDATACAHADVVQSFAAAAGRAMDGWKLLRHLDGAGARASDGINVAQADKDQLDALAEVLLTWYARQYVASATPEEDAWSPEQLEYRFSWSGTAQAGEKVLAADGYASGHLDWYSSDIDRDAASLGAPADVTQLSSAGVPVPIQFPGMPNTRWWAFEDGRVNLGSLDVSTTDLGRMAYLEFALLFANDWYMLPLTLPSGSLAQVRGIAVTTVFNERYWVRPTGSGIDDDWQRCTLFTNSIRGNEREIADTGLLLAPVSPKIQQGAPLDEVLLTRDEMANLVWGIERNVALPDGRVRPGAEVARELRRYFEQLAGAVPPAPVTPAARLRYQVMSSVAEHWIPFLSARRKDSNRETLLQRGSMLRHIEGDAGKPRRITPRTPTLREGLDQQEPYFINEETVPRAGVVVKRAFRRARGYFGKTYVWLGMQKQSGRGEGQSGLAYDQLLPQEYQR